MPTIDSLMNMYRSSNLEIQVRAAKMLVSRSGDVPIEVLIDILEKFSRDGLGRTVQQKIRERKDSSLPHKALQYLNSEDDFLRETGCHILGDTSNEEHVNPLAKQLNDPVYMVRRAALHALEEIGTASAREVLSAKLSEIERTGDSTDMQFWLGYGLSRWPDV